MIWDGLALTKADIETSIPKLQADRRLAAESFCRSAFESLEFAGLVSDAIYAIDNKLAVAIADDQPSPNVITALVDDFAQSQKLEEIVGKRLLDGQSRTEKDSLAVKLRRQLSETRLLRAKLNGERKPIDAGVQNSAEAVINLGLGDLIAKQEVTAKYFEIATKTSPPFDDRDFHDFANALALLRSADLVAANTPAGRVLALKRNVERYRWLEQCEARAADIRRGTPARHRSAPIGRNRAD